MSVSSVIRQTFLGGLLVLLPLYLTWQVLSLVFQLVDAPLGTPLDAWIGSVVGHPVHIPGLGILATAVIVVIAGTFARSVLFRRALHAFESLIDRVPIVRSLYSASRQVVSPFAEGDRMPFKEVVLVEYPMKGRFSLAFVARPQLSDILEDDRMVVFIPTNHVYVGNAVIVHRRDVQVLPMTVEQAIKFVMSGGIVAEGHLFRLPGT